LKIKANDVQAISLEVTPAKNARAGEYPVLFRAQSEDTRAEIRLTCILTGTYAIDAYTPTGLLSLDVNQGKRASSRLLSKYRNRRAEECQSYSLQAGELEDRH